MLKDMPPRVFRFIAFIISGTIFCIIMSIMPPSFQSAHFDFFFLFYIVFSNTIERLIVHLNKDTECREKFEIREPPIFSPKTRILLLVIILALMARLIFW